MAKVGRPTKYQPRRTPQLVREFTAEMTIDRVFEYSNYTLAHLLGITYDTFNDWRKEEGKEEFSQAVKELETKRAAFVGPAVVQSGMQAGKACFFLKNWTHMRDQVEFNVDVAGGLQHGVMIYGEDGKKELSPEEYNERIVKKHGASGRED